MYKLFLIILIVLTSSLGALKLDKLLLLPAQNPFAYNLNTKVIVGKNDDTQVTICCHGYGHNQSLVHSVHSYKMLPGHLIGFNFPDHDIKIEKDHSKTSFGTIDEILPLLFLIKQCVVDLEVEQVNLYGFSAGGGAVINALGVLNRTDYDIDLENVGIDGNVKQQIIGVLEKSLIILNCPLKSFDEVMALHGQHPAFKIIAANYKKNNMTPLDAIDFVKGLSLTILLHFQNPDEILSNRDDQLFINKLRAANAGKTMVIIGNEGGHNVYHSSLWDYYKNNF